MTDGDQSSPPLASAWAFHAMQADSIAKAVQLACVIEATAPKVGNVHPTASFSDLGYLDFVIAAESTSRSLCSIGEGAEMTEAIWQAVASTQERTGTNVNLGIVLLLAPILAGESSWATRRTDETDSELKRWQAEVAHVLSNLTTKQGGVVARAIALAAPGGVANPQNTDGTTQSMNVLDDTIDEYDLLAAMNRAATYDQIAASYADGFQTFFEQIVPLVNRAVSESADLLSGLVLAHLRMIACWGDSLVARKVGYETSAELQRRAAAACQLIEQALSIRNHQWTEDPAARRTIAQLDQWLRQDGNRLNPGTSADFMVAAVYVCLRLTRRTQVP